MGGSEFVEIGREAGLGVDATDAANAADPGLDPAPKARKKRGRGNVWTTVTATPEQRVIITDRADRAGMSVSSYLVQRGLQDQVVVRTDWRQWVARLTEVNARLAEVSALLEDRATPLDAVRLGILLCRIEDAARGLLTPAQKAIARMAEDIDFTALDPAQSTRASVGEDETTGEDALWPEDDPEGSLDARVDLSDREDDAGGHR